jgi:hypothetical protein
MIKNIFIYWAQGFSNAPFVVKMCLFSWKIKNPRWTLYELDDSNLSHFINIDDFDEIQISKTGYSDIVRIHLLERYGGCWCDATTFCNVPLDDWLPNVTSSGFFAFARSQPNILLSSWFLYCDLNNHIPKAWKNEVIWYWQNPKKINYFWFHRRFTVLYMKDSIFKQIWDSTPKISATPSHFLQEMGLTNNVTNKIIEHIQNKKTPVYKLSYKYDNNELNNNSNLSYLFQLLENYQNLFG